MTAGTGLPATTGDATRYGVDPEQLAALGRQLEAEAQRYRDLVQQYRSTPVPADAMPSLAAPAAQALQRVQGDWTADCLAGAQHYQALAVACQEAASAYRANDLASVAALQQVAAVGDGLGG